MCSKEAMSGVLSECGPRVGWAGGWGAAWCEAGDASVAVTPWTREEGGVRLALLMPHNKLSSLPL